MFAVWLVLAVTSLLDLIIGVAWLLWARGQSRTHAGGDAPGFYGRSIGADVTADVSYTELKALVRAGRWGEALPVLLMIGGLLGLFIFGSLAFWTHSENELLGVIVFGICLYAVGRTLYHILQA